MHEADSRGCSSHNPRNCSNSDSPCRTPGPSYGCSVSENVELPLPYASFSMNRSHRSVCVGQANPILRVLLIVEDCLSTTADTRHQSPEISGPQPLILRGLATCFVWHSRCQCVDVGPARRRETTNDARNGELTTVLNLPDVNGSGAEFKPCCRGDRRRRNRSLIQPETGEGELHWQQQRLHLKHQRRHPRNHFYNQSNCQNRTAIFTNSQKLCLPRN